MNNSYNLLMTRRKVLIDQDLNEEYIRKFNLSIETIKRKKRKTEFFTMHHFLMLKGYGSISRIAKG